MTYNITEYYGPDPRARLLKNYQKDELQRDLTRAKEDLGEIALYIRVVENQIEITKAARFKWYVEFRKENNYGTKHINYRHSAFQLPDIPDADKNATRIYAYDYKNGKEKGGFNNPFLGNEKKGAIAYALELSAKYGNCEIVGNAADLIPKKKDVITL